MAGELKDMRGFEAATGQPTQEVVTRRDFFTLVGWGGFLAAMAGVGVGSFNACSNQWGASDLGAQFGGFLTQCIEQLGYDVDLQAYRDCVTQKCQSVFGNKQDLVDGCYWFTNWFECADNPVVNYAQISCPQDLPDRSGLPGR